MNLELLARTYTYSTTTGNGSSAAILALSGVDSTWLTVAIVLSVIGGILAYVLFVKGKTKLTGFWAELRELCDFKKLIVEDALKIIYLVFAIFITLTSLSMISQSFLGALMCFLIGNLTLRISCELVSLGIMMYRNLVEINAKLKK